MSSTSATLPLTTWELVKMIGPIILFGILLPTVDNVTDLRMIFRLFIGIPGCKLVDPNEYLKINGTHWQDVITCTRQDPEDFCQLNTNSTGCAHYYEYGFPDPYYFTGCSWDYNTCNDDPATYCHDNPDRFTCAHYRHTKFASMFLGIFNYLHALI